MNDRVVREFYRCLASDASSRALLRIRDILADDTLSDENCFHRIEALVCLLVDVVIDWGVINDFVSRETRPPFRRARLLIQLPEIGPGSAGPPPSPPESSG